MIIKPHNLHHWVLVWLFVGVVMVFFQIMIGGVTRLTGSGLSITKWEIVTGTIPPLNEVEWDQAFSLYKNTPQYQQINKGMSLSDFKFIFFWEYIHRLWARTMGFVFLIPFFFFIWKKALSKQTIKRLAIVVLIALCAAVFGWVMVASGLISRPWVSAYKLTIHLSLGISLFIFLFYTWMKERGIRYIPIDVRSKKGIQILIILGIIQVCFGGFVSGMKAALNYPTWPLMNGQWIPELLFNAELWNLDSFLLYDQTGFMAALVQVVHRFIGYSIVVVALLFSFRWMRLEPYHLRWLPYSLVGIIVVQVLLGIFTLIGSKGSIPVLYGTLHQSVGILFLTFLFYINIRFKAVKEIK